MRTIPQAFEEFLQSLELTPKERDDAIRQHTNLRKELQDRLDVGTTFLSGSYARSTAVRPLNDIDVFAVLKPNDEINRDAKPLAVLGKVQKALEEAYSGKTALVQSRSVNIEFSGTGIAYDVVPAFEDRRDVYVIPDRDVDEWIETNPREHAKLSTEANEAANKKLKPLVKAIKRSNYEHRDEDDHKPARSFHLEVLSWSILTEDPGSYHDGLITLLEGLKDRMEDDCPDPAGFGSSIQPSSERCAKAKEWAGDMLVLAKDAKRLADDGRTSEAHYKLRELFGSDWPEKGTAGPKKVATPGIITGVGATDDPRGRHG